MTRAMGARVGPADTSTGGYLYQSELPLTSLAFLLPLIVVYEVGTRYFTTAALHGREQQIIAFTLMQRFFRLFGVNGQHLPALAVATILICWHLARHDRWHVQLNTLIGMAAESILLALPLIALGRETARYFPLLAVRSSGRDVVIMSLGAGVYEELVFRLAFFALLSLVVKDALRVSPVWSALWVVVLSAFAFSAYHYLSPAEHFQWRSFLFRTAAGAYFGVLFLLRGFGITAGCHAAYDILILYL